MSATEAVPAGHPQVGGHRGTFHARRLVAALAATQTVGYGTLYYAFAVLLHPVAASLHASITAVTGALTACVLAGAAMAVPVGWWLDRHGGRLLMSLGSLAGTLLLVAWSHVHTLGQLYAVQVGIGLASAMVLYEPAFAVIVAAFDPVRRANALLGLTVVAGFASSIFLPATGALVDRYGWRTALLLLAAVHGAVTVPLHALVLPRRSYPGRRKPDTGPIPVDRRRPGRVALRDGGFRVLAVVFVAHTAALAAMTVHLVGYLTARGHRPTFAASVAGLLGLLSVTGRLVMTTAQRRARTTTIVAVIFAVQAAAAAALIPAGASPAGAIITVIGFGLGFGVATLARPALLADRYGTAGYATIAGLLAVPVTLAKALAPLAAALLLNATNYATVLATIAAACTVGAAGMLVHAHQPRPRADIPPVGGRARRAAHPAPVTGTLDPAG
jgi:MFS family permease